jgi:LmbE family N-acetylglucosaminyl deacetylase
MTRRLPLALLLLVLTLPGTARSRAVRHPGSASGLSPQSVLWIAAHPDDEAVAAPLLGRWCRDEHARCGFLLMTRGQQGACLKPGGCEPDVPTVRAAEAAAASQLFGAELFLLQYQDGGGVQPPDWRSSSAGDAPDVVSRVAGVIEAFHPSLILTFDPRHGTTCHPDHRETANLVLDAVKLLPYVPQVYLLESRITFSDPFAIHFASAVPSADRFDATQDAAWSAVLDDMERHPSQFDATFLDAIRNVPSSERAVWYGKAADMLDQPATPCQ